MDLLTDTQYCRLCMRRECREHFPRHRGLTIPACITARAWHTCRDVCRDDNQRFPLKSVAGKVCPAFPAHAQPSMLRVWQEAHVANFVVTGAMTTIIGASNNQKFGIMATVVFSESTILFDIKVADGHVLLCTKRSVNSGTTESVVQMYIQKSIPRWCNDDLWWNDPNSVRGRLR